MSSPKKSAAEHRTRTRGLHALDASDPIQADEVAWGRRSDPVGRRGFLSRLGLASMSAAVGAEIVFWERMPAGLIPVALAQTTEPFQIPGKEGLTILNDRPIEAETPAHLLDDDITPGKHLFVRNNGHPPALEAADPARWTLEITGESCAKPQTFTLQELKDKFEHHTLQMVLECAGNGRSEFNPPATGVQWTVGAVGCPMWTGIRLRDVLNHCGVKKDAVYIGYYGADLHLSGDPAKPPISRGVPIGKALADHSLLAFAMNGEDIPWQNGHPLRLVFGGWIGSTCGKWVNKIAIRDREHDGEKMTGDSYRLPRYPVAPGSKVPDEDMEVIGALPVKSLITYPKSGVTHPVRESFRCRGHAWAGESDVSEMHVSIDFGTTWQRADLRPPPNRHAWQRWTAEIQFPKIGYYEIWARATDGKGRSQPMVVPGWNPRGYINNCCHRIAVQAI